MYCRALSWFAVSCNELLWNIMNCHEPLITRQEPSCKIINSHELSRPIIYCHNQSWTVMKCHKLLWTVLNCHEQLWTVINCPKGILWLIFFYLLFPKDAFPKRYQNCAFVSLQIQQQFWLQFFDWHSWVSTEQITLGLLLTHRGHLDFQNFWPVHYFRMNWVTAKSIFSCKDNLCMLLETKRDGSGICGMVNVLMANLFHKLYKTKTRSW